ncbi:DUF1189 domain-containing protein [Bacillus sp. B-jedd]|uniref:DUF1189 domain-containing protein n=1 Tax=Bacillus sp. B-jedd TaxID=1476857 RepID=UPI0005156412|nr:DUF1189 domain-containing protein [Bacillus sp. B-jedd]CEG27876.1 factor involved in motility [Bacillus sp. B-jedd]
MNIFKQLYKSLYSPRDIAIYRFQGIGKTILYVFLLTFISILPTIYHFSVAINTGLEAAKEIVRDEMPDFKIKNGILETELNMPVTIKRDEFSIIIDPTGSVSQADLADMGNAFGFLKDEFGLAAGGRVQSYSYAMLDSSELSKQDFVDFIAAMDGANYIILPIVFFFVLLVSSAMKFIEVSVLAVMGLMLKNMGGRRLNYGHLWRMSAYSVTISTIFFTIMEAIKTVVPSGFLINWLASAIVLYLAVKETPAPKKAA